MEATTTLVSLSELKRLLSSVVQQKLQLSIRYRTLGHLWYPNFLPVAKIEQGKSILFHDAPGNTLVAPPDVQHIIQFELNGKFYPFEPNSHYQVSDDNFCKD